VFKEIFAKGKIFRAISYKGEQVIVKQQNGVNGVIEYA
jgi:hypothetical protein